MNKLLVVMALVVTMVGCNKLEPMDTTDYINHNQISGLRGHINGIEYNLRKIVSRIYER